MVVIVLAAWNRLYGCGSLGTKIGQSARIMLQDEHSKRDKLMLLNVNTDGSVAGDFCLFGVGDAVLIVLHFPPFLFLLSWTGAEDFLVEKGGHHATNDRTRPVDLSTHSRGLVQNFLTWKTILWSIKFHFNAKGCRNLNVGGLAPIS